MRGSAELDALSRSYQDAWNSGEGRAVERLMLVDAVYHDVPSQQIFRGSQIGAYLDAVFRTYRHLRVKIFDAIQGENDCWILRWQTSNPEQASIQCEGVDVIRFEVVNGRQGIKEVHSYYDRQSEHALMPDHVEGLGAVSDAASRNGKQKYLRSGLSPRLVSYHELRLLDYLENNKPYLNNRLSLPNFARDLELSVNHLSQIINSRMNTNFHGLINRYRVGEAKQILLTRPWQSVLDTALQAGFHSSSAFYVAFKKSTGMSPAAFKKKTQVSN